MVIITISLLYCKKKPAFENDEKGTGRFDFLIYILDTDKTIIPHAPCPGNEMVLDEPPEIFFEYLKNAYLYLFLFSPEMDMTVLFPHPRGNFPNDYTSSRYFIPDNNTWSSLLHNPGTYTLSFIISTTRLKKAEQLMSRYANSCESGAQTNTKTQILARLVAEIEQYKRKQEWMKNTNTLTGWDASAVRSLKDEIVLRSWSIPFQGIITHTITFQYSSREQDE